MRPDTPRGDRWFVDETYVKVAGTWTYQYRAVDQYGQVIDVLVSARRDAAAARRFFARQCVSAVTVEVTTDCAGVYRASSRNSSPPLDMSPISTPTTRSRPIMGASKHGCGQCAD